MTITIMADVENKVMASDEKQAGSLYVDNGEEMLDSARETKLLAKLDAAFVPVIMVSSHDKEHCWGLLC